MEKYNEHYFENGVRCGTSLYSNYRWMPELTIPMAFRMIEILDIKSGQTVLDFGCAKGFLVKSLRLLYRNAYGVDVSQYAVNNCDPSVANYIRKIDTVNDITDFGIHFDHIISKDVFEHISYDDIFSIVSTMRTLTTCLFAIVPLGDKHAYTIDSYELDTTHVIRENKIWWSDLFKSCGFTTVNSEYRIPGLKDNYSQFERGNGFFILT